ncbi:MAG: hypothetical protein AB7K52_04240 [Phycisphaerales bacterium]
MPIGLASRRVRSVSVRLGVALATVAGTAPGASAQSTLPAVFVANNGNLEGSVSSFTVGPNGALSFVQRLIIGITPSSAQPVPGTNAYTMTISPDGRFLATTHATASEVLEQVTIMRVGPDASLTLAGEFQTPNSPLGCRWVTDEYLAVTRTAISGTNHLILYRYDRDANMLTEVDREPVVGFCTSIAVHPNQRWVYTQETNTNTIFLFHLNDQGRLDPAGAYTNTPYYPLGLGITPDGRYLYAAGGISGGGSWITGHAIDADGSMTGAVGGLTYIQPGPFIPGGDAPKVCVPSPDSRLLFVGHGRDATVRVMNIDEQSGVPGFTSTIFDVGLQGSLGDIVTLPHPTEPAFCYMYVTDNFTATDNLAGVYAFRVETGEGEPTFTMIPPAPPQAPPLARTGANQPSALASWQPPTPPACPPDFNADGTLNADDLGDFINCYFSLPPCDGADFNGDAEINADDLGDFINAYFAGC